MPIPQARRRFNTPFTLWVFGVVFDAVPGVSS